MAKYRARTALSVPTDPKKPWRTRLVRQGDEIELTDDQAAGLRERGVLLEEDEELETAEVTSTTAPAPTGEPMPNTDPEGGTTDSEDEATGRDTELPARPSNNATKDAWRAYLTELKAVTDPEMDDPLEIPADATRDQMIAIGDQRVAEWNEE